MSGLVSQAVSPVSHFAQRHSQFRRVGGQPRQLRRGRLDDRLHTRVHIVEAGQHRVIVFGVIVGVGRAAGAALELPIRDQGLEIGVDGAKVVVSGGQRGRSTPLRSSASSAASLLAPAGGDPHRRTVDQQAGGGELLDGLP